MLPPLQVHHFLRSRFHVLGRAIRVWLPRDHALHPQRRYPVVYLQDGQNVFANSAPRARQSWDADTTAQRLIDAGKLTPLMLVAVDNAGLHRVDDYTSQAWRGRGGHAEDFGRMLVDEIKPFVDAHYPTRPERAATALVGASLGGLFALQLALTRPDVFGGVAALSPTTWWANGALLRMLAALPAHLPVRIWIDAGKREAPPLRQGVRAVAELLLAKGWHKHRTAARGDLRHLEVPRGRHDELAWGRRLDRVLQFLFPQPRQTRRGSKSRRGAALTG